MADERWLDERWLDEWRSCTLKKLALVCLLLLSAIGAVVTWHEQGDDAPSWARPAPSPSAPEAHPRGGSVRIAVVTPPELVDRGTGGNTVRQLTEPRLFDAQPDGTWRASLVVPGTDRAATDGRSATFELRPATWSNGSPITVDDLRRTADARFVERVDDPDTRGRITVHFRQRLPGWRQLWSSIPPATPSISGGPFVVTSVTSGYETILHRNELWFGAEHGPFLDELRLQYVPDVVTARQLLAAGDVDVVHPLADTVRLQHFESLDGVAVDRAARSGRWMALQFNVAGPPVATRLSVLASFPRRAFVDSLLAGEGSVVDSLVPSGDAWRAPLISTTRLEGVDLTLTSPIEHPLSRLLDTSFSRAVGSIGARGRERLTDTATVMSLVEKNTYDVAFVSMQDGPVICWQCRFGSVDPVLAVQADAGDRAAAEALERKVRDDGVLLPLWRETPMMAWRPAAVAGVQANGFVDGDAWAAETWWKP